MATLQAPADAARAAVKDFPIILVTGGTGYIGSHTVLEVLKAGCAVVVVDNLCNSHLEALIRVYYIARAEYVRQGLDVENLPPLIFHNADMRDRRGLSRVFQCYQQPSVPMSNLPESKFNATIVAPLSAKESYKLTDYKMDPAKQTVPIDTDKLVKARINSVIHFAALKAVGDSVAKPLAYYQNNINGLLNLLDAIDTYHIPAMVFSSSAVVYGTGKEANISEDSITVGGKGNGGGLVTNPYGRSKWFAEEMINDYCIANPDFTAVSLRYFNPTGSHPSGLIGEDPKGIPNNIVPVIMQAIQRKRSKVYVFGSEYNTNDGTGVRDYIHVSDLARGHLAALRSLIPGAVQDHASARRLSLVSPGHVATPSQPNYRVYNLGTGQGYSVLEILQAFAMLSGQDIPFAISDSRPGDLGTVTAATSKASNELGWQAEYDLQDMCRDVYTWATENPVGYERLRRLSAIMLKDPGAMRKASVAVGLKSQGDLLAVVESFTNLATNPSDFDEIIRRLSTISGSFKDESGPSSLPDEASLISSFKSKPTWDLFGDGWKDQHTLPVQT